MPNYFWRGNTSSSATGSDWGFTGNWLNSEGGVAPNNFPVGGDTVIFGASAAATCLYGGLSGGFWIGYTSGDANSAGDITVIIDQKYGATFPNNTIQVGSPVGSTGPLKLKVQTLYVGLTAPNSIVAIENIPGRTGTNYGFAHINGITSTTFHASGTWKNIVVTRGSLVGVSLTSNVISLEGVRGSISAGNTAGIDGYGIGSVTIGPSDIEAVVITARGTQGKITINGATPIIVSTLGSGIQGVTNSGATYISVEQNVRPAGLEKQYNRITRKFRYFRG